MEDNDRFPSLLQGLAQASGSVTAPKDKCELRKMLCDSRQFADSSSDAELFETMKKSGLSDDDIIRMNAGEKRNLGIAFASGGALLGAVAVLASPLIKKISATAKTGEIVAIGSAVGAFGNVIRAAVHNTTTEKNANQTRSYIDKLKAEQSVKATQTGKIR